MPDPHQDLADIIEPQISSVAATSSDGQIIGLILICSLAVAAALYWYWQRSVPLRTLHRLRSLPDPQQAASRLASLVPKFKTPPEKDWLDTLQRLRFGPPDDDARAVLEALCQQAETLLQRRR